MEALGRQFDIGLGFAVVDINTANSATGLRCKLTKGTGVTIVMHKAIGTAGDDPTVTLKQHTASTGGTTANLAIIDHYYLKTNTSAMTNGETWTKVTQAAAATIADPGGAGTSAESQQILAIEVGANQLSDGYTHVSLDYAVAGLANAQLATVLYIVHSLDVQRKPANLANLLNG